MVTYPHLRFPGIFNHSLELYSLNYDPDFFYSESPESSLSTFAFDTTSSRCRAYPGSEFVVANTLAKWKDLEPNEINFSQGFSQKVVSTTCFVFNSLPAKGNFCCLLMTFANSLDPDQARQNVGPDLDPNCLTP